MIYIIDLHSSFKNIIIKINDNITLIELNLNSFSDVTKWIEKCFISTYTKWNV